MMRVKLIVGFRRDQEHSIPASEAHKAYYLFLNPEARSVFSTGLAIKGSQIDEIVPDWQGTMGWSPTHVLDGYDWAEINRSGKGQTMQTLLAAAKEIGQMGIEADLKIGLRQLLDTKYPALAAPVDNARSGGGLKQLGEIKK